MADHPPAGRQQPTRPPPIPARAPVAPLSGETDVVSRASHTELAEETSSVLQAPDAALLVGHILELVASEVTALLTGDDRDERLADLNVRTALASWDALHQPDEALRLL